MDAEAKQDWVEGRVIGTPGFYLWVLLLAALLFFPARQIIWILSVRREEARDGREDEARRLALKRRAGFTSALLCFVFAFFFISYTATG